jgi:hypothetical protein
MALIARTFVRYRIRYCCRTCGRWDVLQLPNSHCVDRFSSWSEALAAVKRLQYEQIANPPSVE